MSGANLCPPSNGGLLNVSLAASMAFPAAMVREIKTCELCGVQFTRMAMARTRECSRCRERLDLQAKAEEAARVKFRESPKRPGRPRSAEIPASDPAYQKAYRAAHREKLLAQAKARYAANVEARRAYRRAYRREYMRNWRKKVAA